MITPKNHPIKFLLQFEWVLLLVACLIELPQLPIGPPGSPLLAFLLIGGLALLGLALPDRDPKLKYLHLASSFSLLILAAFAAKLRLIFLLYVVLVMRACLMFPAFVRVLITITVFGFSLFHQIDRIQNFEANRPNRPQRSEFAPPRRPLGGPGRMDREERLILAAITSTMLLGLVLGFVQLMIDAVLSERQSREQLEAANGQLRRYALRIEDVATLQERNRIAREIHDSLGHSLTAFNLHVEAALRLFNSDPEEAQELLVEAKQLGSNALQSVRESVSTLRSHPLQGKSLEAAIGQLTEDFARSTGIVPDVSIQTSAIPEDQAVAFYRIIQEALTNISKYAQAIAVSIQITQNQLEITDDGRGFDPQQTTSGFGLQGMQERTSAIGGQFELISAIGRGCTIRVMVPPTPQPLHNFATPQTNPRQTPWVS
jgi:signal transduction histidine kinase